MPDVAGMCCSGKVIEAYPHRRLYFVRLDGLGDRQAVPMGTGIENTFSVDEKVACTHFGDAYWRIMGKVHQPINKTDKTGDTLDDGIDKSLTQQTEYLNQIIGASGKKAETTYVDEDKEEVPLEGDQSLRGADGASVSIFAEGSIISRVTDTLLFLLHKGTGKALLSCKTLICRIIPGITIKFGTEDAEENPNDQAGVKPQVTMEVGLSSDPDKPKELDYFLKAGAHKPSEDPRLGATIMKRGIRLKMKDFGYLEIDNDTEEVRLTINKPATDGPGIFRQLFINPTETQFTFGENPILHTFSITDELISGSMFNNTQNVEIKDDGYTFVSGGPEENFISLTQEGCFIKANKIGFAGPIHIYDPLGASYQPEGGFPDQDSKAIEWYKTGEAAESPGLRFTKSVYFGNKGEPAVLKSFLTTVYAQGINNVLLHTHMVGQIPTTPTVPPFSNAFQLIKQQLVDPVVDTYLSLTRVPS